MEQIHGSIQKAACLISMAHGPARHGIDHEDASGSRFELWPVVMTVTVMKKKSKQI